MKKVTGEELNRLHDLGASQARYRKDGLWYHPLRSFPGALCDSEGYVLFDDAAVYASCAGLKHGPSPNQIHVPNGIKTLQGYTEFS